MLGISRIAVRIARRPIGRVVRLCALFTAVAALTQACAVGPPLQLSDPDPSDPSAPTRPVAYRSTVGRYVSQRPVSPGSWQEQNQRVTPRPSNEGDHAPDRR